MTVLETEILNAVKPLLTPYLEKLSSHRFEVQPGLIEVKCQQDENELTLATLLRVGVLHEQNQVQIPNLVIPAPLKGQGLGKTLIKAIYVAAKAQGYEVLVTDMTPSFYQRLLRRGASPRDEETVQINDETALA